MKIIRFALTVVLWIGLLAATRADTHYVAQCGQVPSPNYLSWTDAASNIQDAIDVSTASDTVLVSNGVYQTGGLTNYPVAPNKGVTNRVVINKAIIVRSANNDPTNTIIKGAWDPVATNGDAAVRCVYMTNGASLIGFMLTNGATQTTYGDAYRNGGGVWCESTNTIISNCVMTGNSCGSGTARAGSGAGAHKGTLYNCLVIGNHGLGDSGGVNASTLYNCRIIGNSAPGVGGGASGCTMYNCEIVSNSMTYSSSAGGGVYGGTLYNCLIAYNNSAGDSGAASGSILSNCTIANNSASGCGGGMRRGILYNCTVISNSSAEGGGVYDSSNYNCLIAYNSGGNGRSGGAERCYILANCTIVSNRAKNGGGASSSGNICNSIIYFNTSTESGSNWYGDGMNFTNCCTFPTPSGGSITWTSGITNDPQLANKDTGNFRLSNTSPCINTGTNLPWMSDPADTRSKDLDGYRRLDRFSSLPDMGCYEYVPQGTIYCFH